MRPSPSSARSAARDLRNVPDPVMFALLRDPTLVPAICANGAILSFPVFEYLWEKNRDNPDLAIDLVTRHLTHAQRALVLPGEERSRVLRALLNRNVLTHAELRAADSIILGTEDGFIAFDYYERDPEAMSYLLRHANENVTLCYILRSNPELYSDTQVLAALNQYCAPYRGSFRDIPDSSESSRVALALRDLLEIRPHLVPKLLSNRDTCVRQALADSHHVANPDVLTYILGVSPEAFTKDESHRLGPDTLLLLSRNFFVPFRVRSLAIDRVASSGSELDELAAMNFTLSPLVASITNQAHLRALTQRALCDTGLYSSVKCYYWELLALAENPNLSRNDIYRIAARLGMYSDRQSFLQRVGPDVASRTFAALKSRCPSFEIPTSYAPEPRYYIEEPGRVFSSVNLDEPVTSQFAGSNGVSKDAAPLVAFLGESPATWVNFIQSMDRVPEETTVRDLANTTLRITK